MIKYRFVESRWSDALHTFERIDHGIIECGVGTTLWVGARTVQVMSDIWETWLHAVYWDRDTKSLKTECFHEGRPALEAVVDYTPEVLDEIRSHLLPSITEAVTNCVKAGLAQPLKGDVVKVMRGRSNLGIVGPIVAEITANYNSGYRSRPEQKVAIATSDRKVKVEKYGKTYENYADVVWVWKMNVELVAPKPLGEAENKDIKERTEAAIEKYIRGCLTQGRPIL